MFLCSCRYKRNDTDLLDFCTFLDPRTKSLAHLPETKKKEVQDRVIRELKIDGPDCPDPDDVDSSNALNIETEKEGATQNESGLLSSLLSSFHTPSVAAKLSYADVAADAHDEIRRYLRESPCELEGDPLDW